MENLKTLAEISAKYKLSIFTLYHWIRTGKLKTVKIGRKHFVNENDLLLINSAKEA